jgi:hypothetical protein
VELANEFQVHELCEIHCLGRFRPSSDVNEMEHWRSVTLRSHSWKNEGLKETRPNAEIR